MPRTKYNIPNHHHDQTPEQLTIPTTHSHMVCYKKQHTYRGEGQDLPKVIRTNDRRSTLLWRGVQWRDLDNRRHVQFTPTRLYRPTISGSCETFEEMHHLNLFVHIIPTTKPTVNATSPNDAPIDARAYSACRTDKRSRRLRRAHTR